MFKEKNAASYVQEPIVLQNGDNIEWNDQADIVVVGLGGAGVCAAIESAGEGADVLAVERFDGGGATALCGGIVYGGGTSFQESAGIEDSPEEMYKYLKEEIGDAVRDETLRSFCQNSASNFQWLCDNGLAFGSNVYNGKRSYPPKGFDIYYSGNEAAASYATIAKPAQRGHRVSGAGYTGVDFFEGLKKSALKKGLRIRQQSKVSRLVTNNQGQVVGVEVLAIPKDSEVQKQHLNLFHKVNKFSRFVEPLALKKAKKVLEIESLSAERLFIKAKKGVILTTGSFAFNREMVRHYAPKYGDAFPLGTISCDGSGVLMGQSVGGAVGSMDSVTAWRSISPPEQFVKNIVVNKSGQRFIAEDTYLGHLGRAIADQQDQKAWLVIDSSTYWNAFKDVIPRFGEESYVEFRGPLLINLLFNTRRGKTLAALADKIGVDAKGLEQQVAEYNAYVENKEDPLQKKTSNLRALGNGSYYAIDISVGSKKYACPTIPMGGLQVDEDSGQVLNEGGQAIDGLYAAGRAAVGIPSGFYVSGSSLADCVFSGRRAGRHAAQRVYYDVD